MRRWLSVPASDRRATCLPIEFQLQDCNVQTEKALARNGGLKPQAGSWVLPTV